MVQTNSQSFVHTVAVKISMVDEAKSWLAERGATVNYTSLCNNPYSGEYAIVNYNNDNLSGIGSVWYGNKLTGIRYAGSEAVMAVPAWLHH